MDVTHGQSTLLSPDVAESRAAGQQPASLSLQAGRDHRRAITEPADESMYVPMSRAVGAHYANPPRSQSAPPARPYGDSSKFLRRFDGEGRQSKRHAPEIFTDKYFTPATVGDTSWEVNRENFESHLRHRRSCGAAGEPTGANSAIYGGSRLVGASRACDDSAFDEAYGRPTRPAGLAAAEAGDAPGRRFSIITAGAQIWNTPGTFSNQAGAHVKELLRDRQGSGDASASTQGSGRHGQPLQARETALDPVLACIRTHACTHASIGTHACTRTCTQAREAVFDGAAGSASALVRPGVWPPAVADDPHRLERSLSSSDAAASASLAAASLELTDALGNHGLRRRSKSFEWRLRGPGSPVFGESFGRVAGDGSGGGGSGDVAHGRTPRGEWADSGAGGRTSHELSRLRQTNLVGAVVAAPSAHARTPLAARYIDGSLIGPGARFPSPREEDAAEDTLHTAEQFGTAAVSRAGAGSVKINQRAAERATRPNERVERLRVRGWEGEGTNGMGALLAHSADATSAVGHVRPMSDYEAKFAGAAGQSANGRVATAASREMRRGLARSASAPPSRPVGERGGEPEALSSRSRGREVGQQRLRERRGLGHDGGLLFPGHLYPGSTHLWAPPRRRSASPPPPDARLPASPGSPTAPAPLPPSPWPMARTAASRPAAGCHTSSDTLGYGAEAPSTPLRACMPHEQSEIDEIMSGGRKLDSATGVLRPRGSNHPYHPQHESAFSSKVRSDVDGAAGMPTLPLSELRSDGRPPQPEEDPMWLGDQTWALTHGSRCPLPSSSPPLPCACMPPLPSSSPPLPCTRSRVFGSSPMVANSACGGRARGPAGVSHILGRRPDRDQHDRRVGHLRRRRAGRA